MLVLSIPDWGVTPFAKTEARDRVNVSEEIDAFNAAAREIAQAHGVVFVDITPASRAERRAGRRRRPASRSARCTRTWTQLALPVARKLLAQ